MVAALASVEQAAAEAAVSREALDEAIRKAHGEGASLRAIAQAAGLSHEQVRRVVAR